MKMKIVLATNNRNKIREIIEILSARGGSAFGGKDLKAEILTLNDFPNFPNPKETEKTLEENAILKAKACYNFTKLPSMADDSGLEVDALNKAPGVISARFAGPRSTYHDNNLKLLRLMKEVPKGKRNATFRCVVAIVLDSNNIKVVEGKVRGIITEEEIGPYGFGYDPVFYYPKLKKTFAQLTPEEKNRISHRAIAFRKAKKILEEFADFGV